MKKFGLVGSFAVLSLIPIVLLGLFLGRTVSRDVREKALAQASQDAELIARLGIQPLLSRDDLSEGLGPERFQALDDALRGGLIGDEVARIKIWNRESEVIYSDDPDIVGRAFPQSEDLRESLEGQVVSEISELDEEEERGDRRFGQLLEVYVPLRFGGEDEPAGAFEIYLPYRPIEASIEADTRHLYIVLVGGLLLLYATLFPIVARTSVTLRRQAAENERLALRDPLTDLPNRILFRERVDQAIRAAHRAGSRVGVMIIDVDRFKEINDTLGHHTGDLLLAQIGSRLRATLREADTVARLGGDEFGILLPDVSGSAAAMLVAEKIVVGLERPLSVHELTLEVEASIGIALFPDHGDEVDGLLRRADVAMYVAKEARSRYELYAPERDRYSPRRLALLGELRRAIQGGELVLHYQPKTELRTGRVTGAEALVRWQHPTRGLLPPDEFIPLAEPTGLIGPLTSYVVGEALRQCRAWRDAGLNLDVAVNLSVHNLQDPGFPGEIAGLLDRWELEPSSLELEITENAIMQEPLRMVNVLERLSDMGVELSIDDFGVGHSSLAYLKRLPVTELKIDKSFITNMAADDNDAVIVRSTIDLGRNLGLRVVAEGVESEEVLTTLTELGCDMAQGFHLSRPLPAEDLTVQLYRAGFQADVKSG